MNQEQAHSVEVVEIKGHSYVVAKDGRLVLADSLVAATFNFTALELAHLKAFALNYRMNRTEIIRAALLSYMENAAALKD